MGWYSVVVVLHDSLHAVLENPAMFVKNMGQAIDRFHRKDHPHADVSVAGYCNAAEVVSQAHSDEFRMVVAGGNTGLDLGTCGYWRGVSGLSSEEMSLYFLRYMAEKQGYRLVKKKRKSV